jgi:hypothetical protein
MNNYKNIYIGLKDLSEAEKAYMRRIDFNINTAEFPKMTLPELRSHRVAYSIRLREIEKIKRAIRNINKTDHKISAEVKSVSKNINELNFNYELPLHITFDMITKYRKHLTGCINILDYCIRKKMKENAS